MIALLPSTPMLLAFLTATLAILVVPGPSVAYVLTRSLEHGRRAGIWSVLGLETGAALHVLATTAGLAALVASSATAFTALQITGAGYLVWLAIEQLRRSRQDARAPRLGAAVGPGRVYLDGVLVDLLNPKTALFFLAFLPQFVDHTDPAAPQLAVLGLLFVGLAGMVDGAYAILAGRISHRMQASSRARRRLGLATGGVYLALAAATLIS